MEGMSLLEPVRVGDTVSCYARVEKIGRTSMTIPVEVWVTRHMTGEKRRVTHGVFTLVAVDEFGKPIPVKRDQPRMDNELTQMKIEVTQTSLPIDSCLLVFIRG